MFLFVVMMTSCGECLSVLHGLNLFLGHVLTTIDVSMTVWSSEIFGAVGLVGAWVDFDVTCHYSSIYVFDRQDRLYVADSPQMGLLCSTNDGGSLGTISLMESSEGTITSLSSISA